jgi:pyruvate dehydrogenase E2 component (dihydrolipoamide acetyltransferase)
MSVEFTLPELGENVEKGDVIRVLVGKGDDVKKDQPVLELETDKATIEVPSSVDGTVSEVRVKAGDQVAVGDVVLVLDAADASKPGDKGKAEAKAGESKDQDQDQDQDKDKDKDKDKDEGASRAAEEPEESGDADAEAGPKAEPGASGARSENVVDIAAARQASKGDEESDAPAGAGASVPAAPSVRRLARELGVNIAAVSGTGPGGRVGQDDVKQHVKALMRRGGGAGAPAAPPLPDFSKWGAVDVQRMSNIRRKTAEHLSHAWQAPHVTQHDKADVTGFEAFREAYAKRIEKAGAKLTVTAVLIRLLAAAIDRFPQFASSVDMANESVILKQYRHIGVAVDTPNGLLVPVIRDVTRKTITDIAIELADLSQKARDRKLGLDDMAGGVMTLTNLGGIGGTSFTPVINQPEVAILGVSRTATEPVWRDGAFVPRPMLPLSLSYDHRAIDGADAARFLRFLVEALEQPLSMYL